jgi:hypothetical protein
MTCAAAKALPRLQSFDSRSLILGCNTVLALRIKKVSPPPSIALLVEAQASVT